MWPLLMTSYVICSTSGLHRLAEMRLATHLTALGGGCTQALNSGLAGEDIQLMGDWASTNYLRYFDMVLDRRILNMVKFMATVECN